MPEFLQNFSKQFAALSPGRQAILAVTALGSLAFFGWVASGAQQADYRLLYRGLDDAEVAQVVDGLTAERIEYQLGEGGSAILVPSSRVHEARMRMASRGLPSGSTPGFELFDQGKFGVTDFVQKVNYSRALQGELARTIEQVEGVEKARIQLAIPERRTLLRKDDRRPTASIVTRLRAGWDLDASQVRGIVHLVASSVEGLDVSQVTLVDNHGRLLAPQADMDFAGQRGAGASLGAERRLEKQLEEQIESILARTVGLGRVVAKVSAELDWTQTEQTQELYDPDGQVARSTQVDSESSSDAIKEGGVAGIAANTPDVEPAEGPTETGSASERTSETVNYEISKTVSRSVLPTGQIERLSIAVLVDGKPLSAVPPADGETEGEEVAAFAPWSADELVEFEELAKRAVGFDVQRGDEISVINSPFIEIDTEGAPPGFLTPDVMVLINTVVQIVALLVGLFLFSKLFVRPLADAVGGGDTAAIESLRDEVTEKLAAVEVDRSQPVVGPDGMTVDDMEIPGLVEQSDEMTLQQQVDRLAQLRADDSVRTIRGWMATGG